MLNSIDTFFTSILRHPWFVIAITAIFFCISFSGLDGLVKRSDYKAFLDPGYPGMVELDEIESIFNENKSAFLVVVPQDGDVFNAHFLSIIQKLTERCWEIPYAYRVDSLTNFQHTIADGDDLLVTDLVPKDKPINSAIINRASQVAAVAPPLLGLLVSEQQDVAAVNVTFQFQDDKFLGQEQAEVSKAIDALISEFIVLYPEIRFHVAGNVVIDYISDEYSARVNNTQAPLMLGLIAILLMVLLKSFWGSACTLIIVILTGIMTMGVFGWIKLEIDGVTAIAPIVIMTLAVVDSVHIIAGMLNGMRLGMEKMEALAYSLKLNFTPVFLTSLTTVLGVITFTFTDFPSLRKLGLIIALGVAVAFVLSVTLLPAILALLPVKAGKARKARLPFDAFGEWVIKYHRRILPISTVVCLACAAMIPSIVINESFENYFDDSTSEQQAIIFMSDNLSGFQSMDVAIFSNETGGLNSPEFLATVESFAHWVKMQTGVTHVSSITDTFKRLNRNMHEDDPKWYILPDNRELAAQYLLLYEMSLPYGLDLNNQINMDKSATRLTVMIDDVTSADIVALKHKIYDWFEKKAPNYRVVPTGMIPLMSEVGYLHMIPSMMKGGIIAILMVSLVLFFALRSWSLGLLGMLANVTPIAIGYGLWGATIGMVNFPVMSVAGICLGVVVDFAVHFLNKYQQGYREGGTAEDGVRFAFNKVASPMWITMIVLSSGFWVLATSPFRMVGDLGLLTGVIIVLALIFDLLVLPTILLTFSRFQGAEVLRK